MRTITVEQAADAFRKLLKNHGQDGFEAAKTAYLKSVVVVDENGDPADIDVVVKQVEESAPVDVDAIVSKAVSAAVAAIKPDKSEQKATSVAAPAVGRKRYGKLKWFSNDSEGEERAYQAGIYFAAVAGKKWALDTAYAKAHFEYDNSTGGFLVPEEFANRLIDIKETFGVARQLCFMEPMSRDVKRIARRVSGLTAYWVGEGASGTESTMSFDRVSLTAKKLMALTTSSNELIEDSAVSLGDRITGEIALAFADEEDDAFLNGDGTSTYGGIVGVRTKLSDLNGTDDGGGLVLAAGNAYSEITQANIDAMIGQPINTGSGNEVFVCSKPFWGRVFLRLANAGGGNAKQELLNGRPSLSWSGYPVVISNKMPKTEANSQIACLFGDFSLSSTFGDRREMSMAISDSALNAFEQDELVFRGTERVDIVNHDLGDATNAGPVVGLITASG